MVVNPDRRYTHGGVLAALVDLAADWALVKRTGRGVPTVDLRVDYHAAAIAGRFDGQGTRRQSGRPILHRRGAFYDAQGKLLASGRGTYFTALRRRRKREFKGRCGRFENLGDLIERNGDFRQARIIDLGGESPLREFSYRKLDELACGVARALLARGFARGDRVAILSANRRNISPPYSGSCVPG